MEGRNCLLLKGLGDLGADGLVANEAQNEDAGLPHVLPRDDELA